MRFLIRILPFLVYFLPGIIAILRRRKDWRDVFFGSLFLGWTVVGYVYFLSLACESDEVTRARLAKEARRDGQSLIGVLAIVFGILSFLAACANDFSTSLLLISGVCVVGGLLAMDSRKRARMFYAEDVLRDSPRTGKYAAELTELESDFGKYRENANKEFSSWASEAYRQLAAIELRFQEFSVSIGRKLSPRELTHVRYVRAAENLFEAVLSNLRMMASLLASMKSITINELREKIVALEREGEVRQTELTALRERVDVWHSQGSKLDELIGKNESALTAFDKLNASVAESNIHDGRAQVSFEHALADIENLSNRFSEYDRKPLRWTIGTRNKIKEAKPLAVRLGLRARDKEPSGE
jgi:hypothetical protein